MTQTRRRLTTIFLMSFMFMFAVSTAIIGVLLPAVLAEFDVSLSTGGIVTTAQNAGGILALIFCGYLSDRLGKARVIAALFTLMTAALLLCLAIRTFLLFVLVAFLLGLTASSLNMAVSAYLSDLYEEKRGYYVNLAGVFFGAGSVSGTLYLLVMQGASWHADFGLLGIVCTVILLMWFVTHSGTADAAQVQGQREALPGASMKLLRNPKLHRHLLTGFFYMAYSSAFMAWFPTWLVSVRGYDQSAASGIMTLYWLGILLGRMVCTALSMRCDQVLLMAGMNALGGGLLLLLMAVDGAWLAIALAALGVTTGAVFQICLALTCQDFPKQSGTASSMVSLAACVGGTLCCGAVGLLAGGAGLGAGMVLMSACLLVIPPILLLGRRRGASQGRTAGKPC